MLHAGGWGGAGSVVIAEFLLADARSEGVEREFERRRHVARWRRLHGAGEFGWC